MRLSRVLLVFCILLITADAVLGATLHGKIYDIELNELDNVIVEVNSEPNQRYVSKDGAYSFKLSPGDYELTANYSHAGVRYSVLEEVSIDLEGDFVYDLFLFPGLDDTEDDFLTTDPQEEPAEAVFDEPESNNGLLVGIIAVLVIAVLVLLYFLVGKYKKKAVKDELKVADVLRKQAKVQGADDPKKKIHKTPERSKDTHISKTEHHNIDEDLQSIINIMKKEGGRTTQKELRKQIPLSEAKISLMVSELEHKGLVEKVKKGRGNIIILRKP